MLSDDKATLSSCKVKSEDFIHCAISAAPPKAVVNQVCTGVSFLLCRGEGQEFIVVMLL